MALTGTGRRQLALQLSAYVAGRAWCGLEAESRSYAGTAWSAGWSRTRTAAGSPRVLGARLSHPFRSALSCRAPHRGHELSTALVMPTGCLHHAHGYAWQAWRDCRRTPKADRTPKRDGCPRAAQHHELQGKQRALGHLPHCLPAPRSSGSTHSVRRSEFRRGGGQPVPLRRVQIVSGSVIELHTH